MLVLFNNSDKVYSVDKIDNSDFHKVAMKTTYKTKRGTTTRQAFILSVDENLPKLDMSKYVEMDKAEIISSNSHKLIFGSRDLNPMAWARSKDESLKFGKDKVFFFITLKNSINSEFVILNSRRDYYILEYAITRDTFSVIVAMNGDSKLHFTHKLNTGVVTHYEIDVCSDTETVNTSIATSRGSSDEVTRSFILKKFRPSIITEFIITPEPQVVLEDPRINKNISQYNIQSFDFDYQVKDIIEKILDREVRAVTYYGPLTEENKELRDYIASRFRIYYETNKFREVSKVKVL